MPRVIASVSTSSTTEVPVNATTYNEPTSGAQRSLKSSSANDAGTGTGVRTVRITYYTLSSTGAIAGPFVETVTMNGTSAVATVATNIALIEKLEAMTAGAGGVAAGAITLYSANDGTGTAIAQIATGTVRTFLGHHYVPSDRRASITDLELLGGDAAAALIEIKRLTYPSSGVVEQTVTGPFSTTSALPREVTFLDQQHAIFPGPCRLRLLVTPGNGNAQTTRASFGYVDRS